MLIQSVSRRKLQGALLLLATFSTPGICGLVTSSTCAMTLSDGSITTCDFFRNVSGASFDQLSPNHIVATTDDATSAGFDDVISASAGASLLFTGTTGGPVRLGLASYNFMTASDGVGGNGGDTSATFTSSKLNLSCGTVGFGIGCTKWDTLVPFELGVPFSVSLSVSSSSGYNELLGWTNGGGTASLDLQLFDASGAPVTILSAAANTPEPANLVIVALGLGSLFWRKIRA